MTRLTIVYVVILLFGSLTVFAQNDDPKRTMGLGNGRMWATMDVGARLYYVVGLLDGLNLPGFGAEADKAKFLCNCTNGEIVEGITVIYAADPVNAQIPIVVMLRLHVARTKGATKAEIDKEISDFLKSVSKIE